jgi:Skp family chaperone for outer membrane proteins
MHKFGVGLALVGVAVFSVGCGQSGPSSRGGIAVVDLDKVAAETGKSVDMREALQAQANAYKNELVSFQNKANAELQSRAKDLKEAGDEASDESKREFLQIRQTASNILAQGQNAASTKLSQLNQLQIAKFRAELKPIVQEAAAKRGLSVVIPKNEGLLLSVDPGVDITDDVIKAYLAKRPAGSAAAPVAAATAPAPATTAAAPEAPAKAKPEKKPTRAASKDAKDSESDTVRE